MKFVLQSLNFLFLFEFVLNTAVKYQCEKSELIKAYKNCTKLADLKNIDSDKICLFLETELYCTKRLILKEKANCYDELSFKNQVELINMVYENSTGFSDFIEKNCSPLYETVFHFVGSKVCSITDLWKALEDKVKCEKVAEEKYLHSKSSLHSIRKREYFYQQLTNLICQRRKSYEECHVVLFETCKFDENKRQNEQKNNLKVRKEEEKKIQELIPDFKYIDCDLKSEAGLIPLSFMNIILAIIINSILSI